MNVKKLKLAAVFREFTNSKKTIMNIPGSDPIIHLLPCAEHRYRDNYEYHGERPLHPFTVMYSIICRFQL